MPTADTDRTTTVTADELRVAPLESIYDLFELLGYREWTDENGSVVVELPVASHIINHAGAIQGGFIATLVDTVAGRAVINSLTERKLVVTSDMTIRYIRGVREGFARGTARVVHLGRRSAVIDITITEEPSGKVAAVASANFAIMEPPAGVTKADLNAV